MKPNTAPDDAPAKNKGGRPLGSMSKLAREAREKAQATGLLPHEFLLAVARGERITRWEPHPHPEQAAAGVVVEVVEKYGFEERIDAAKAAAPYYAPKISTVEVIAGVNSDDLDELIARAAAEAGISLVVGGEGEEEPGEGAGEPAPRRRRIE